MVCFKLLQKSCYGDKVDGSGRHYAKKYISYLFLLYKAPRIASGIEADNRMVLLGDGGRGTWGVVQ